MVCVIYIYNETFITESKIMHVLHCRQPGKEAGPTMQDCKYSVKVQTSVFSEAHDPSCLHSAPFLSHKQPGCLTSQRSGRYTHRILCSPSPETWQKGGVQPQAKTLLTMPSLEMPMLLLPCLLIWQNKGQFLSPVCHQTWWVHIRKKASWNTTKLPYFQISWTI